MNIGGRRIIGLVELCVGFAREQAQRRALIAAHANKPLPSPHAFNGKRADRPCATCDLAFVHPLHAETWTRSA